jgi:hypothetical protein
VNAVINHLGRPERAQRQLPECDGFLGTAGHKGLVWRHLLLCWRRQDFAERRKGPMLVGPAASGPVVAPVHSRSMHAGLGWSRWPSLVAIVAVSTLVGLPHGGRRAHNWQ